jgi:hypothetical protein
MMINAEKKCRQIKSGRIPFSPESLLWIRRAQVYWSLLQYHHGLIRNIGNLKRAARRCGILQCLSLLKEEVCMCLDVCVNKCNNFCKHGQYFRRKHLYKCLQDAKDAENKSNE